MKNLLKPTFIVQVLFTAIVFCYMCRSVSADVVHLKNGNSIEGIIQDFTEGSITIKVDIGTITFSLDEVESIEKSSSEERKALKTTWEKKRREEEIKIKAAKAKKKSVIEKIRETFSKKEPPSPAATAKQSVPSKIGWVYNFNRGMQKAKSSGKPVMVDFYTEWCGWCKKLDRDTYTDKKVRALSINFVCIKVDADKNKSLAKKYSVKGYPTILFLNSSGRELGKLVGYRAPNDFAPEMEKYIR